MNCERVRESLLDVATGAPAPAEVEEHVRGCAACRAQADELRATLALMDEWQEVEPSPYFDQRLRARVREEAAVRPGFWAWLRKPALAAVFVLMIAVGVGLIDHNSPNAGPKVIPNTASQANVGSAVSDLQSLDKNEDLYANFDVLDDVTPAGAQAQKQ